MAYFQYPCLHGKKIAFVVRDTLWLTQQGSEGCFALASMDNISWPLFSPDGQKIAFISCGDVYVVHLKGGIPQRLTYTECVSGISLWEEDGSLIVSASYHSPFRENSMYRLNLSTRSLTLLSYGPSEHLSFGKDKMPCVLQRDGCGYTSWKRYRGGTRGTLWIDPEGKGDFVPLMKSDYNLLRPFVVEDRIYFLSDFEGIGQLYSCDFQGKELRCHTEQKDFYVRHTSVDHSKIIYTTTEGLYIYECLSGKNTRIDVALESHEVQRMRSFEDSQKHLQHCALNGKGDQLSLITRGRLFQLSPWKGPAFQRGKLDGARYRQTVWLSQSKRWIALCDEGLQECLEIFPQETQKQHGEKLYEKDLGCFWGRAYRISPCPRTDKILLQNHRHEMFLIDLSDKTSRLIARSPLGDFLGHSFSPCGRYIAYASVEKYNGSAIRIYDTQNHQDHGVVPPTFYNSSPVFDEEGRYLYFLSSRSFICEWDHVTFDLGFQPSTKPFVIVLDATVSSPLLAPLLGEQKKEVQAPEAEKNTEDSKTALESKNPKEDSSPTSNKTPSNDFPLTTIDFQNISSRIDAFPVPEREYTGIVSLKGRVLYMAKKKEGSSLFSYSLSDLSEECLGHNIQSITFSADKNWMLVKTTEGLCLMTAGASIEAKSEDDRSYKKGGWLDWERVVLAVSPFQDWCHMFDESWRLQKEFFWTETMCHIDWSEIYQRYRPMVERVGCYSELMALIRDMQGELGTSHAYVMELKETAEQTVSLDIDIVFDTKDKVYRIASFLEGDLWNSTIFRRPGLSLEVGDILWSIAGFPLSLDNPPEQVLLKHKDQILPLVTSKTIEDEKKQIFIHTRPISRKKLLYRQWVEKNRAYVHDVTKGQVGYVHIPCMSTAGFSEFIRSYSTEFDRLGLVVDVRFNGGGNISPKILAYLTMRRLGYDQSRWQGAIPYPSESPRGPMVALINQLTGSDGDIFAHSFKALKLGQCVGKDTWGGTVGISPRNPLIEGTMTSQPEYAFYFFGPVGWGVENHGVGPDIYQEIRPQDFANRLDPQLDKGIELVLKRIEEEKEEEIIRRTAPSIPNLKP